MAVKPFVAGREIAIEKLWIVEIEMDRDLGCFHGWTITYGGE